MGDGDEPAKVPNPYLAALKSARSSSTDDASSLRTAMKSASTAMSAGAWVGGKADAFGTTLDGMSTDAKGAADGAMDEFDRAIGDQAKEPMVSINAWQVRWQKMR